MILILLTSMLLLLGYESDLLMRTLPSWQLSLERLSALTLALITGDSGSTSKDTMCSSVLGPDMTSLINITADSVDLGSIVKSEKGYFRLNNGLLLPAVGLGTCK